MSSALTDIPRSGTGRALGLIAALVAIELVALSLLYQHGFEFTCRDTLPVALCAGLGRAVPRALGILAALALFAVARRARLAPLWAAPDPRRGLALHLAGFAAILAPWAFLSDASSPAAVTSGAALWLGGLAAAALGLARMLAPGTAWRQALRGQGAVLAVLLLTGALLPELADRLMPLWDVRWVTDVTFATVRGALEALGYATESDPSIKLIGARDFFVRVGPQCSGVEGFALVTVFLTLYMALFRQDLRFPQVLVLFPLGLLASWAFNVTRIVVLLVIGIEGAPDLAVGGFHSHAGWLAFTLLSVGLIAASRLIPGLARAPTAPRAASPFLSDPVVAQILPFIVFMASALLASTFFEAPARAYPLRAVAMAAALALVWPWFRALPWRIDALSVAAGAAIGLAWVLTTPPPAPDAVSPIAGMGVGLAALWIVTRVIGTALLVPLIEEALFRGYLIDRLAPARRAGAMVLAIGLGAVLFAALHDRWLAAGLAGLVFGGLVWRSGNLTDAMISHGVANGTIAAVALATGAWHII